MRLAAAESAATRALFRTPDFVLAHLALGVVYILINRATEGIAECEQAMELTGGVMSAMGSDAKVRAGGSHVRSMRGS